MNTIKVRIAAGLSSLAAVAAFTWIAVTPAAVSTDQPAVSAPVTTLSTDPVDSPWY